MVEKEGRCGLFCGVRSYEILETLRCPMPDFSVHDVVGWSLLRRQRR